MHVTGATIAVNRSEGVFRQSRSGDAAHFAEVYRKFGRPLYATALRMMRKREDAEDVVQDTFLAYHGSSRDLPDSGIGPWLQRVAVNRCLDRLRRGQRWRETDVEDQFLTTEVPRGDLKVDLDRAVAALPEKARVVFLLHDVEGMKHREIGELLEISEGTAKSQLFRARRILRASIDANPRESS